MSHVPIRRRLPVPTELRVRHLAGLLVKNSKLSATGAVNEIVTIPGIGGVIAGQTFHVIEVYYNYLPYIVTYVGKGINTDFYDRTIFTNVSGSV